ncbi:hypothetical protein [Nocardioides coralli]|uniref:hypothetical protein n=1 Tax=Nocardioides coralli TaxID=2872154 RepID=UPI001CA3FAA0|nr:hypothetical protein [Nocardioides coralli]QZY28706.1 hypothetical protein K6T13_14760 [Nocardioides coralli]
MPHRTHALVATVLVLGQGVLTPGAVSTSAPSQPEAPTGVTAAAGEQRATVAWVPPAAGTVPPPETRITRGPRPRGVVPRRSSRFTWASTPEGLPTRCTLDRRAVPCEDGELRLSGLGPGTHGFTVAARDPDGGEDPSPAARFWTVPLDDRHLDVGSGWRRGRQPAAYRGTLLRATRRGATLSTPGIDVRALALVASVGPRAGSVTAFLGGRRLGEFDLQAPSRRTRRVIPLASFAGVHNGRIRVVVRSRGKPVVVDGLAVETWFVAPRQTD